MFFHDEANHTRIDAPQVTGQHVPAEVSVVVIGLNEGQNLPRCFQSILKAKATLNPHVGRVKEIIYIDSASTDNSVSLAKQFCTVVAIVTAPKSAAAARQAGLHLARAEYVLFLDGDMELDAGFLDTALLDTWILNESKAGIIGIRDDHEESHGGQFKLRKNVYGTKVRQVTRHFGGAFLAKREHLSAVGGYDPLLKTGEEPDLHARLVKNGKRVLELPVPFVTHYTPALKEGVERKIAGFLTNASLVSSLVKSIREGYLSALLHVYYPRYHYTFAFAAAIIATVFNPLALYLFPVLVIVSLLRREVASAVMGGLTLPALVINLPNTYRYFRFRKTSEMQVQLVTDLRGS